MPIVNFAPAARKGSHVLIALYGESGSGKTFSGLLLARGLVGPRGKLGMLDTETGRGLIYADEIPGGYDYAELTPPFTPERYIEAIKGAEDAGYEALVIDSASHEWEGIGGVIEMADSGKTGDGRPLQGLIKWAQPKARHKKFVQALLATRMHLIICLRAKEKIVQKTGSKEIVSEGFVSVQDKRFIFETTVQLFMHNAPGARGTYRIEKCPQGLLPAFPDGQKITVATGERIGEWVRGGAPVDHALERLKRAGEEAAEAGTKAFTAWWNSTDVKPHRASLRPFVDNFKSIATTADQEAEQARSHGQHPADADDDPFGSRVVQETAKTDAAPASPFEGGSWGEFVPWFKEQIRAMPREKIADFISGRYGREYDHIADQRPGDRQAIDEIIDARRDAAAA